MSFPVDMKMSCTMHLIAYWLYLQLLMSPYIQITCSFTRNIKLTLYTCVSMVSTCPFSIVIFNVLGENTKDDFVAYSFIFNCILKDAFDLNSHYFVNVSHLWDFVLFWIKLKDVLRHLKLICWRLNLIAERPNKNFY